MKASPNQLNSFRPGACYRGVQAQFMKEPCAGRHRSTEILADLGGGSNSSLLGASWGNACEMSIVEMPTGISGRCSGRKGTCLLASSSLGLRLSKGKSMFGAAVWWLVHQSCRPVLLQGHLEQNPLSAPVLLLFGHIFLA